MPSLDDLQLFVRVAEAGSLSAAARRLALTPAAVSAALARLERELGVKLVARNTRAARLSAQGERFLARCEAMLALWEAAREGLQQDGVTLAGDIHVAAPADCTYQFLSTWTDEFLHRHPAVRVIFQVDDRIADVLREALDLAVRYGELEDSGLVARRLCTSPRLLVAAPDYLARAGVPQHPEQLAAHALLVFRLRGRTVSHWTLEDGTQRLELPVRAARCGDGLLVRQWALAGHGIAAKLAVDVADDLAAGRLQRVLPEWQGPPVPVHAVLPGRGFQPARVRALADFYAERFAARAAPWAGGPPRPGH